MIQIARIHDNLPSELQERLTCTWGRGIMITRGRCHTFATLTGFLATDEETGRLAGIVLLRPEGKTCELVVLESIFQHRGVGTRLLECATAYCRQKEMSKLWLVVTNDNINAIRFYQKRGFDLKAFHEESMTKARASKPQIPLYGYEGIPIKHELEFELSLK